VVDPKALKIAAKPSRELTPGAVVDGRYRVVKALGSGGTAVVYEVEHQKTGRRLALKLLADATGAARLEQEAKATAKLKSRHAVRIVDVGSYAQSPYLVMSFLEGTSLRELLRARKTLDLATVANIVLQLTECLDEAHSLGLVHRDLKPENIHLRPLTKAEATPLLDVTVLDFGVVKMPYDDATTQLTRTGSTVGTPFYMSLEQLRGASTVDAQSDVYSLSVMLYECFTGAVPFQAATLGDLVFAICSAPPVSLTSVRPELPASLAEKVMAGLASSKAERPKSMREVAEAFAPYADPGFTLWLRGEHVASGDTSDVDATKELDAAAVAKKIAERLAPAEPAAKGATLPSDPPTTTSQTTPAPRVPVAPRPPGLPRPPPKPGEAPKIEPPRIGPPKIEPQKGVVPKIEPPKIEPQKGVVPKIEPPKGVIAKPAEAAVAIDEPTTTTDDARPAARDRDTPTEMYVKDVHGRVGPPGMAEADGPTPESDGTPDGGSFPTMNLDVAPIDSGEATAVLQMPLAPQTASPFAAAPDAQEPEMSPSGRHLSMSGAVMPTFGTPSQAFAVPSTGAVPVTPQGVSLPGAPPSAPQPGYPYAGYPGAPGYAAGPGALAPYGPGSQRDVVQQAIIRFRTATPTQQALVVGIAAAIGAVILVTLVFLIFF
jgi:serine/threonine-protein kinase